MSGIPHYKIRVSLPGGTIYLASTTPPVWHVARQGYKTYLEYEPLEGEYGDTVGFIDWTVVNAVTWRFSAEGKARSIVKAERADLNRAKRSDPFENY